MICFDAEFPDSCLNCPIRQRIGCNIAANRGIFLEVPSDCPFEPAYPVDETGAAKESNGFEVAEMVCLMCLKRFIDVRPVGLLLKDMECPGCHKTGFIIETGEYMVNENS